VGAGEQPPPPSRGRAPELAPAVVLLVAFAAFGSCRAISRTLLPPAPPPTLAIVGDSITESARSAVRADGAHAGWSVTVDATAGAMTLEKQPAANRLAARNPTAAVIHLGTNDSLCIAASRWRPGTCRYGSYAHADRDRELAVMARTLRVGGACVVGVVPFLDAGVGALWEGLLAAGAIDAIADWRTRAGAHRAEWIADDIGHLTGPGQAAYARFVIETVDDTCAPTATHP
jgi:hypothetical protein